MDILEIFYGEELSHYKALHNNVRSIIYVGGNPDFYEVWKGDGTVERLYDVKRVIYKNE